MLCLACMRQLTCRIVLRRHPDKNAEGEAEAKNQFQRISAAYTRLTTDYSSDEEDDDFSGGDDFFDEDDNEEDPITAAFFAFMCEPALSMCHCHNPLPFSFCAACEHVQSSQAACQAVVSL